VKEETMILRLFLLICCFLFWAASPVLAARYALLIGCNDGGNEVDPLKYAEADAGHFAGLLTKLGGFDQSTTVTLLHPDSASLAAELRTVRAQLRSSKTPESDLFLLYYSGHADGRDLLLGNSKYPLTRIQSYLDSMPSGIRIGIFDACQSGAVTAFKGGRRAEPFYLKDAQKIKGQVIIASAAANERAQESESLKGSVFSFYWLSGLRGSADASGDRRVTLNEAYTYAYRKTIETSTLSGGEAQHPVYRFNIHGEGDITLTDLASSRGGMLFDKSCEGKFLILSDSYTDIYADFFKKKNIESFVTLDPGDYTVINANGGSVGMYSFALVENDSRVLAQTMLVPNTLTESRIKGVNPVVQAKMSVPSTSPLSVYRWGLGIGGLLTNTTGAQSSGRALSLSFANSIFINERALFFFNGYYFTGGLNAGADVGFDYIAKTSTTGFVAGGGAGLFYLEKNGPPLSDALTPALTAHLGFTANIGTRSQFLVQIPYTALFGLKLSHQVGIEVRFLFSGGYEDVKVLHY
jgi:hypothetical protein